MNCSLIISILVMTLRSIFTTNYQYTSSPVDSLQKRVPARYFSVVSHKSLRTKRRISRSNGRLLKRMYKQEYNIKRHLQKVDSMAAKEFFTTDINGLSELQYVGMYKNVSKLLKQNIHLESMNNVLKFLTSESAFAGVPAQQVRSTVNAVNVLQMRLHHAKEVSGYIRERQRILKLQLSKYISMRGYLCKMDKAAYYYTQQLNEHLLRLAESTKLEQEVLALVQQMPAYKKFSQRCSGLTGYLDPEFSKATMDLQILQTRKQVHLLLQEKGGKHPDAAQVVSQRMDQAKAQLDDLKERFPGLINAGDKPDFKPKAIRTKPFWQRLEMGGNVQFQRSGRIIPVVAEIAGQLGYRFHRNGSAGMGLAYKAGLGNGWNEIALSREGIGLRAFVDWRLRNTFFINGSVEQHYMSVIRRAGQSIEPGSWMRSVLLGISKQYAVGAWLKGNLMLLYDLLASDTRLLGSPVKLRMGYSF
ncbi:hypothetical protein [Chitinophaga rhizophila]|uniref:Uncharacterized protein n=1 Tax=Chitinophaga rhizophila TaxID=2866212 RepID=A0ABS7GJ14_9BACT|nr:hypothetical protein [Chitinophaga rhizophila]MBW8687679.1 hypothetical protein [Chitinophaga rhizophila]